MATDENRVTMASSTFSLASGVSNLTRYHQIYHPISSATARNQIVLYSSSSINSHCSILDTRLRLSSWLGRCHAADSGEPPEGEPPSNHREPSSSGVTGTLSRFQDTVQIFGAVLFWMSLFFWSSAWNGKTKGRSNKGPRFRK